MVLGKIDVGTGLEKSSAKFLITSRGRDLQRNSVARSATVHIGAPADERANDIGIARIDGIHNWSAGAIGQSVDLSSVVKQPVNDFGLIPHCI